MNAITALPVDGAQLAAFIDAIFRYADRDTFLSLRAFYDDVSAVFAIQGQRLGENSSAVLPAIETLAARCTRAVRPVVFCPPLATFTGPDDATEAALANGLALSVECDRAPGRARAKLESVIGPATVVVASGGEWIDPETGEVQEKLHLHWRLNEPTRTLDDHRRLKQARVLATVLVGGDASNKPVIHPIRWPGSWHRKGTPRLARVVTLTDYELDLDDALERLGEVAAAARVAPVSATSNAPLPGQGEERDTSELVRIVLTGSEYHAPVVALAARFLRGGMADAQAVLVLRGIMQAIPPAERDIKDGMEQPGRWQSRYDDVPRAVSTARAKCTEPATHPAAERTETSKPGTWPQPLDFLADADTAPRSWGRSTFPRHCSRSLSTPPSAWAWMQRALPWDALSRVRPYSPTTGVFSPSDMITLGRKTRGYGPPLSAIPQS